MNVRYARLIQIRRKLSTGLRRPAQFWLLGRMLAWSVWLRSLRPFTPTKWLVWLAIPRGHSDNVPVEDALRYLGWLEYAGFLARSDQCLVRSLVCQRYLSLAGLEPALYIGFDGQRGHSWVEVRGQAVHESAWAVSGYRPILTVPPGSRQLLALKHNRS